MTIKIKHIVLDLKGVELTLTADEARELYIELGKVVSTPTITLPTVFPNTPSKPYTIPLFATYNSGDTTTISMEGSNGY
jgi:hypothetical protein